MMMRGLSLPLLLSLHQPTSSINITNQHHQPHTKGDEIDAEAPPTGDGAPTARRRARRQQQLLPGYIRIRQTRSGTSICWPVCAEVQQQQQQAAGGAAEEDGKKVAAAAAADAAASPLLITGKAAAPPAEPIEVALVAPTAASDGDKAVVKGGGDGWQLPHAAGRSVKPGAAVWLSESAPPHSDGKHQHQHGRAHHQQQPHQHAASGSAGGELPEWLWCLTPGGGSAVGRIPRTVLRAALQEGASSEAADAGGDGSKDQEREGAWRGWQASIRTIKWGVAGGGGGGGSSSADQQQQQQPHDAKPINSIIVRLTKARG